MDRTWFCCYVKRQYQNIGQILDIHFTWTKNGQRLDCIIGDLSPVILPLPIGQTLNKHWTWTNLGQSLDFITFCHKPSFSLLKTHPRLTPSPPKTNPRPTFGPLKAHSRPIHGPPMSKSLESASSGTRVGHDRALSCLGVGLEWAMAGP